LSRIYETYPGREVGVSLKIETQSMSGKIPALKTVHKHTLRGKKNWQRKGGEKKRGGYIHIRVAKQAVGS